jgi:hypothetical protein
MTNKTLKVKQDTVKFPIREDANGARAVFLIGNERDGGCVYVCKGCNVRDFPGNTPEENKDRFLSQFESIKNDLGGRRYHALIYNEGNATHSQEMTPETLDLLLNTFDADKLIDYVSINSREELATKNVLDSLAARNTHYPLHFILGQESFSPRVSEIFGNKSSRSLEKFVTKIAPYNQQHSNTETKGYVFGLDANLLFLPEFYLEAGEKRKGNETKIITGIKNDLRKVLDQTGKGVPIEINIHCYSQWGSVPYASADFSTLLDVVPDLQAMVEQDNQAKGECGTHIFLGQFYAERTPQGYVNERAVRMNELIADFNKTGTLRGK